MKTSLLTSVAAFGISLGCAYGADLPSHKAPEPTPISWTGFYAGLNAGYGWGATTGVTTTSYPISDQSAAFFGALSGTDHGYGEGSDYIYDYIASSKFVSNYGFGTFALANSGIANVNKNGFIGGGQVGYNWQFPLGGFGAVVGLEADFQGSTFSGSGGFSGAAADGFSVNGLFSATGTNTYLGEWHLNGVDANVSRSAYAVTRVSANVNWLGTVRARLGFLATPALLVYGTGGLAYGGVSASSATYSSLQATGNNWGVCSQCSSGGTELRGLGISAPAAASFGQYSGARVGWSAGGGLEWMITPNWSVKAEGLYYDLGRVQFTSSPSVIQPPAGQNGLLLYGFANPGVIASSISTTHLRFDGVIARAGVNYHFNWNSAPIVAAF
jgi:outer membrane immunogenic protein